MEENQGIVAENAEELLGITDKQVSEHILASPTDTDAKEKNKALTQREAAEHDLEKQT